MKILIVDDIPSNLKLLRAQLESEGCSVSEARDGVQALALLAAGDTDVVISDILMPNMDGFRLCYEIRHSEELCHLPFVMYTATYTSPADSKLCFDLGADEYLQKPATTGDIVRSIAGAMASVHLRPTIATGWEDMLKQYSEQLASKLLEREHQLAQTAERIRLQVTALETANNAILITDRRGVIEWVNPAFTALTGFSPQEAIGRTPRILKSGKHSDSFYLEFWDTITSGSTWRGEFTNCRKGGELYYDEHTVTPVFSADGTLTHFVGIMHDVTERKRAEEEIRSTHAQLNHLLANSPAVIYALQIRGEEIIPHIVSENVTELLGFGVDEVMSYDWWAGQIHPEDRDRTLASLAETITHGTSTTEYRMRHKDGSYRSIEDKRRLTFNASGKPEEIVGVWSDITERHEMENALRKSEERFREMLENVELIAIVLDTDARVTFCNDHLLRLTGWSRDEVLGNDWFERFIPNEDSLHLRPAFDLALEDNSPTHVENPILTRSGEVREIVWSNTTLKDSSGAAVGVACIGEDVTERNRATAALKRALEETERQVEERTSTLEQTNEELIAAKQEADRANAAKSEFLSGMSHELRTPLNAVLGFAQLLEMDTHSDAQGDSIDHILSGGRHLLDLINEILELSRIESGRIDLSIEPVSVSQIVKETTLLVNPMAEAAGVQLIDTTEGSKLFVLADRLRLRQVIMNLLSNAIKYNVRGGSAIVTAEAARGLVNVSVEDTGAGVPPEQRERLFVPFERLGSGSKRVEGTGLGLSISRKLCESMGGTVEYRNRESGRGSVFTIALPIVSEASADGSCHALEGAASKLPLTGSGTVLYIEDNPANLELMQALLSGYPDIELLVATTGVEGLDLASRHKPGLVLLDLNLPDIKGAEVLERLKSDPALKETPVIVVSADATPRQIRTMTKLGAHAYLTKPLAVGELVSMIGQALAAKAPAPGP